MSSEILREAAALMRDRAEAATRTEMPWDVDEVGAVWAQENDGQHDATPAEWDAARAYVTRHAPDCADVLFGLHETRDNDQRVRLERGLRGVR